MTARHPVPAGAALGAFAGAGSAIWVGKEDSHRSVPSFAAEYTLPAVPFTSPEDESCFELSALNPRIEVADIPVFGNRLQ